MHILFVSNNFPPEVNAPATRLSEHARHWVRSGHKVDVLTSIPNFPEGVIYEGYKNRFTVEECEGIRVYRVPMYVSPNKGIIKRILGYVSFMVSACFFSGRLKQTPDVIVATSPQFFTAIAGYVIGRRRKIPFVLEIRDLWPDSIVAVGAMSRNAFIRVLEKIELYLYTHSDRIVVLTEAFKRAIEERGIDPKRISVVKNGVDLEIWNYPLDQERLRALRSKYRLDGKFVVSYIGTIGMAHRADVLFEAANLCADPEIVFVVVGAGAERDKLLAQQTKLNLPNFRLIDKVSKEDVGYYLALTDISVVHLRTSSLFTKVIPSKMFEAMAARTPLILGVDGEAKEILIESGAGISVPPEDAAAIVDAVLKIKQQPIEYARMVQCGYDYVRAFHNRSELAQQYIVQLSLLVPEDSDTKPLSNN